jgi:hypothetical protein
MVQVPSANGMVAGTAAAVAASAQQRMRFVLTLPSSSRSIPFVPEPRRRLSLHSSSNSQSIRFWIDSRRDAAAAVD